jgi:hypothetical protein
VRPGAVATSPSAGSERLDEVLVAQPDEDLADQRIACAE